MTTSGKRMQREAIHESMKMTKNTSGTRGTPAQNVSGFRKSSRVRILWRMSFEIWGRRHEKAHEDSGHAQCLGVLIVGLEVSERRGVIHSGGS